MTKIRKPRKKDLPPDSSVEQTTQVNQPTQAEIDAEVTTLANDTSLAPRKRIWEVDFLRGFMILFVVWDHFMWDIYFGSTNPYQTGLFQWLEKVARSYYGTYGLRALTHDTFVSMFVFTSGVSCAFSNSNGKRAIKMICFAMLLSAVTFAASSILGADVTVNFNVIHVIALSVLIWAGLEWLTNKFKKDWQHNLYGWLMFAIIITVLIVGYQAKVKPWTDENRIWFFLAEHSHTVPGFSEFWGGDYLAFFPDFAWFLVGGFLGKYLYKQKTTLFPKFNAKWVSPITFCGKYSIWVYFGTQLFMYGFFYLFNGVLNIL
ncbi:MAG: DUF1624 domain-containing protein [Clostridia bacterium]|nr:DUF1624 domain-containing protein [Clostridia bacterium]